MRKQNTVTSTDSECSHDTWSQQPSAAGGPGPNLRIHRSPIATWARRMSTGVFSKTRGSRFRESYLIDPKGVLWHIAMNDLRVGRSADEALRLVQAFQFTIGYINLTLVVRVMLTRCGADKGRARRGMSRELEGRREDNPGRSHREIRLLLLRSMANMRTTMRMVPGTSASTRGWGGGWVLRGHRLPYSIDAPATKF